MKNLKSMLLSVGVAFGFVTGAANAAIDVTAVTSFVSGDTTTAFIAVAGVILAFYAVIMAYKIIKRFLH